MNDLFKRLKSRLALVWLLVFMGYCWPDAELRAYVKFVFNTRRKHGLIGLFAVPGVLLARLVRHVAGRLRQQRGDIHFPLWALLNINPFWWDRALWLYTRPRHLKSWVYALINRLDYWCQRQGLDPDPVAMLQQATEDYLLGFTDVMDPDELDWRVALVVRQRAALAVSGALIALILVCGAGFVGLHLSPQVASSIAQLIESAKACLTR